MEGKVIEHHRHYDIQVKREIFSYSAIVRTGLDTFTTDEDVRKFLRRFMVLRLAQEETVLSFIRLYRERVEHPTLVISGPNGSGKTLLCKILAYICKDIFVFDSAEEMIGDDFDAFITTVRTFLPEKCLVVSTIISQSTCYGDVLAVKLDRLDHEAISKKFAEQLAYEF